MLVVQPCVEWIPILKFSNRSFKIRKELLLHSCELEVPFSAPIKSQIASDKVKKTKEIANFKICVERVINCIKPVSVLENTSLIVLLQHTDGIVVPVLLYAVENRSLHVQGSRSRNMVVETCSWIKTSEVVFYFSNNVAKTCSYELKISKNIQFK